MSQIWEMHCLVNVLSVDIDLPKICPTLPKSILNVAPCIWSKYSSILQIVIRQAQTVHGFTCLVQRWREVDD